MCMVCAEDVLVGSGMLLMGAGWYRAMWKRIWKTGLRK